MNILFEATQAIQKNLSALVVYLIFGVGSSAVATAVNSLMGKVEDPFKDPKTLFLSIGILLFANIAWSAGEAIAFSRLGKEMDKPLWKIEGDGEALRRYFTLWFGLNLPALIFYLLFAWLDSSGSTGSAPGTAAMLWILCATISTPVGACLMFGGKLEWDGLSRRFRPMLRELPRFLVVVFFNGIVMILTMSLHDAAKDQEWLGPLIDIVAVYFDCVVFAAMWLICMIDRQNPDEDDLEF